MHIVLGISATGEGVTAALVDVELPHLGPVDQRITSLSGGSVGAAVATAVGVMRLRAARADLTVASAAVVLGDPSIRDSVARALVEQQVRGVSIVDAVDVDSTYPPAVAVALWSDLDASDAVTRPMVAVAAVAAGTPVTSSEYKRGFAVVGAGIAAAVLAGSFAVWAVTGTRATEAAGVATPLSNPAVAPGSAIDPNPAAPAAVPPPSTSPALPPPTSSDGIVLDLSVDDPEVSSPSDEDAASAPSRSAGRAPSTSTRPAPTRSGSSSGGSGGSTPPPVTTPEPTDPDPPVETPVDPPIDTPVEPTPVDPPDDPGSSTAE